MNKKALSLILALILCFALAAPALAAPPVDIMILTDAVFDSFNDPSDGLILVWKGNQPSFVDGNGNTVIADPLKDLRAHLGHEPDADYLWVGDFYEGLAQVLYYDENNGDIEFCCFIDKSGKTAFNITVGDYYYIGNCGDGMILAMAYDEEGVTVFDKQGNVTKKTIETTTGEYADIYWSHFSDSRLVYCEFDIDWDVSFGYLDTNFNIVIPAQFDDACPFNNGLAFVKKGDKWGVIDKSGKFVIEPQFEDFALENFFTYEVFVGGIASVKRDGKWQYIDTKGNTVIPYKFDEMPYGFINGYVVDADYNIIDAKGNVVLKLGSYDDVNPFFNGVSLVGKNGEYSFLDIKGNKVSGKTWQFGYTLTSNELLKNGTFYYEKDGKYGLARITLDESPRTALPTTATVLVNGKEVSFDAYNIDGNNFFKLRDLAYVLSGTGKQFEVTWDEAKSAIGLISGKAYTPNGSEMLPKGEGNKTAAPSTAMVFLDGKQIFLTAYNIDGNNYFKLRDIGVTFNFGVDWDGAASIIRIDTTKGYTPE